MLLCFHYLSDVDECSLGQSHCSSFATCYNTPGSYKCKCKDGYRGMGHDCKRKSREKTAELIFSLSTRNRASGFFFFACVFKNVLGGGSRERGRNRLASTKLGLKFLSL